MWYSSGYNTLVQIMQLFVFLSQAISHQHKYSPYLQMTSIFSEDDINDKCKSINRELHIANKSLCANKFSRNL